MSEFLKLQGFHDFGCSHCVGQVLLVSKHQEHSILHLLLLQHLLQFLFGLADAVSIRAVHNVDQSIGALEVVAPQPSDLILAPHVPDSEVNDDDDDCLVTPGWQSPRGQVAHRVTSKQKWSVHSVQQSGPWLQSHGLPRKRLDLQQHATAHAQIPSV